MSNDRAPVAIGGVGGSGTRLAAQLLQQLGIYIGGDLNQANDLLWFTLLFKREEILHCDDAEFDALAHALVSGLLGGQPLDESTRLLLKSLSDHDRPQHPASWLKARASSLHEAAGRPPLHGNWGWKEPNTHIVIERLWQRIPTLRYIHVVRNGLDMAYSGNQNQLRLWGPHVLGTHGPVTPARSLAYWCKVHQRMQILLAQNQNRMHWLDYDALCSNPDAVLDQLCRFLEPNADFVQIPKLDILRAKPRRHGLGTEDSFDRRDLDYVRCLGYSIEH